MLFLDLLGTLISLLATYYFIRLNKAAWVISIFATLLNGILYCNKGIYADMILEFYYFLSSCYGFLLWQSPSAMPQKNIPQLDARQWVVLTICAVALILIIHQVLINFSNSSVAVLDATTTSLSIIGQWLMCHKIIATWIIWFVTDAIYAYLYYQKEIPFHALLMILYIGMAVVGYWAWHKQSNKEARLFTLERKLSTRNVSL